MAKLLLLLLFLPFFTVNQAVGDVTIPLCSQAAHDSYHATGPDGAQYPTWHPLIDTERGCHYDHEHGSDPVSAFAPAYGYSALAMGMSEGHAGFKGYAIERSGYHWYITQHMGTARADLAACVRMHTLDIAARDSSGALVMNLHLMADFGKSVVNTTGASYTPPSCPTQGSVGSSTGIRQLPAIDASNVGYEPWRVDNVTALPFFSSGAITFNTPNAQTACPNITCTSAIARTDVGQPARGTYRFVTINSGFRVHATTTYSNTFTWAGASQFIAPGSDIVLAAGDCRPTNAFAYLYTCTAYPDEMQFRLNSFVTGAN